MPIASDDPEAQARLAALAQGLQQLGWTVGRNLRIEYRWAPVNAEDIRRHAADLVEFAPEVDRGEWQRGRRAAAAAHPYDADPIFGMSGGSR